MVHRIVGVEAAGIIWLDLSDTNPIVCQSEEPELGADGYRQGRNTNASRSQSITLPLSEAQIKSMVEKAVREALSTRETRDKQRIQTMVADMVTQAVEKNVAILRRSQEQWGEDFRQHIVMPLLQERAHQVDTLEQTLKGMLTRHDIRDGEKSWIQARIESMADKAFREHAATWKNNQDEWSKSFLLNHVTPLLEVHSYQVHSRAKSLVEDKMNSSSAQLDKLLMSAVDRNSDRLQALVEEKMTTGTQLDKLLMSLIDRNRDLIEAQLDEMARGAHSKQSSSYVTKLVNRLRRFSMSIGRAKAPNVDVRRAADSAVKKAIRYGHIPSKHGIADIVRTMLRGETMFRQGSTKAMVEDMVCEAITANTARLQVMGKKMEKQVADAQLSWRQQYHALSKESQKQMEAICESYLDKMRTIIINAADKDADCSPKAPASEATTSFEPPEASKDRPAERLEPALDRQNRAPCPVSYRVLRYDDQTDSLENTTFDMPVGAPCSTSSDTAPSRSIILSYYSDVVDELKLQGYKPLLSSRKMMILKKEGAPSLTNASTPEMTTEQSRKNGGGDDSRRHWRFVRIFMFAMALCAAWSMYDIIHEEELRRRSKQVSCDGGLSLRPGGVESLFERHDKMMENMMLEVDRLFDRIQL